MTKVDLALVKKDIDYIKQQIHEEIKPDLKEIKAMLSLKNEDVKSICTQINEMDKNLSWNWKVTLGGMGVLASLVVILKYVIGGN